MLDLLAGIQLARRASEQQFGPDENVHRRPRRTTRSPLRAVLFLRRSRRVGREHRPATAVRRADAYRGAAQGLAASPGLYRILTDCRPAPAK